MLQAAGYTVETASDGPRGLQQCMLFQPAIIFLDIMMPGMSGLEVLDILREKPEYKGQNAKIVLLTNLGHDDRIEEAWQKKADGYVVKADINATDLIEVINSLMEKSAPTVANDTPAGASVVAEATSNEPSGIEVRESEASTGPLPAPQATDNLPGSAQTANDGQEPPATEQNTAFVQPPIHPPTQT